jgi:hypothetical protein
MRRHDWRINHHESAPLQDAHRECAGGISINSLNDPGRSAAIDFDDATAMFSRHATTDISV